MYSDAAGQDNRVDVDTGSTVGCPAAWCVEIEDDGAQRRFTLRR